MQANADEFLCENCRPNAVACLRAYFMGMFAMAQQTTTKTNLARVRRIFRQLRGAPGVSEEELWQHALFFSKSPEERCRISLQTARSALSLKRFGKKKSAVS